MVERRASRLLARFAAAVSWAPTLPVPAERVADYCDLGILWEPIPEPSGHTILGGLDPAGRVIILNERRRALFDDTPFLYNTVLGHEIAHWELHFDHASFAQPSFPGFERPLQFVCQRGADAWQERHAHWFMSYLLLPRHLLAARLVGVQCASLAEMYRFRDECQVMITAMRITLEAMGRGFVDESGRVHPSKQEYLGQGALL
jgi:hypothetical protein